MMRRLFPTATLAVTLVAACALSSPSAAQTMNYGSLEAMFGEPVTTSATGSPQKASDAPVTMDIITAEDIKRSGVANIADIVSRLAGVNVIQGSAQDHSVAVRGFNEPLSGRLLVLVDGRQVYLDFFGYTDWDALPVRLEEIRQIEVVKGPNTALFGFNAAAGVINIVTFNPAYDDVSAATVRAGKDATYGASGAATYKISDGNGIRLSGGYNKSDEFATQSRQVLPTTGILNRPEPSNYSLAGKGVFTIAEGTQLVIEANTSWADYNGFLSPQYSVQQVFERTASYSGEIISNTGIGLLTGRIYDNTAEANTQTVLPITSNLIVLQGQDLFRVGTDTTVRLSGEWRNNSMKTTPVQSGTVSYDVYSASVMADHKLSSSYSLTGALRFDGLTLGRSGDFPAGVPQTNALWSRSIDEVSYNLGLVGQVTDDHTLRLTTARGLQLPSLFNLSVLDIAAPAPAPVDTGAVVLGNPNLNATVVTNYEFGWDWSLSDNAKFRADAFYQVNQNITAISNFNVIPPDSLSFRPPFPPLLVSEAESFGNSDIMGIEMSFKNRLGSGWTYGLNGSALQVTDHLSSTLLRRINFAKTTPQGEMNAALGWTNGSWTIDGYLKYVSASNSFVSSRSSNVQGQTVIALFPISAYENFDLRIAYLISKGLTLSFEGHNLFDDGAIRSGGLRVPTQALVALRCDF